MRAGHPSTNEKENPMKVKYSEFDSKGRPSLET
jgi:hypothetical protein